MSRLAPMFRPAAAASAMAQPAPFWFHGLAAAWITAMLWLGSMAPPAYRLLLQEDRVVEWGTVWLFLAAGVLGLHRSIRRRRAFDGLVACFCMFVAGEEFSWGQRLLGYLPPEFFLQHNVQQEMSLHNLPQSVQPGSLLMLILAGYGILLPLLAYVRGGRVWLDRLGATPPAGILVPWYSTAIVLLWWYPLTLTSEWIELLAGALFLVATAPAPIMLWPILALTVAIGLAMTTLAGAVDRGRHKARLACAAAEAQRLTGEVAFGGTATAALWNMRRVHKRVWSSVHDGYLEARALNAIDLVACGPRDTDAAKRRKYGIDPWGSPYWLLVEKVTEETWRVTVYSFGPNRRRDLLTPSEEREDQAITPVDDLAATQLTSASK